MCLSYYLRWSITALIFTGFMFKVYDAHYSVVHIRYNSVEAAVDSCHRQRQHVYHSHVTAPVMPDISGEWTSQRCEVRSGPEFLLRKYKFHNNSLFELRQYYYSDPDCTIPLYSVVAKGYLSLTHGSFMVRGATEANYRLSHVTVMPYQNAVAFALRQRVNRTCPGISKETWEAFERYELFNYVEFDNGKNEYVVMDRDCTAALGLSFHELQLIRLELRYHHHMKQQKLFLGSVHTNPNQRQLFRSTVYQEPLHAAKVLGCHVCRLITNSNDYYPPKLQKHFTTEKIRDNKPDISGEWFSQRCELRPNGMFLTRQLLFSRENTTWAGFYRYFADELCHEPTFTLHTGGTYTAGIPSPFVAGSFHFDFKVTTVKITPHSKQVVNNLNRLDDDSCGVAKSWRQHVPQDVTLTKGCQSFGITLPHTEYELVKMERVHHKTLLYLGERPSDGTFPDSPDLRPTSFQPPLVKCAAVKSPLAFSLYHVQKEANSGCDTVLLNHYYTLFPILVLGYTLQLTMHCF